MQHPMKYSMKNQNVALWNRIHERIINKISETAKNPYNIKSLKYSPKNLPNLYKLKAGDWRILFWIEQKEKIIILYTIEHRSRIYRDLK